MNQDLADVPDIRKIPDRPVIFTFAFNPFYYIAGMKACAIGFLVIIAASAIGYLSGSHLNGVLDFHTGVIAPFWYMIGEGILDWLALALLLLISAKILSRTHGLRAIDIIGTQALARFPTLFIALFALLPGYQRMTNMFALTFDPSIFAKPTLDLAAFFLVLLVTIVV